MDEQSGCSGQLPSVHDELLLHGALMTQCWLTAQDPVAAAAGRELALLPGMATCVAPGRSPPTTPRLGPSIGSTGRQLLRGAASTHRSDDERGAILTMLSQAGRAPPSQGCWENGWYCRDYTSLSPQLAEVRRIQRDRFHRFNLQGLLYSRVVGDELLLHASGDSLSASHVAGLNATTARVGDLIEFKWSGPHELRFKYKCASYPFRTVDSFRLLCDTLVLCYPDLLTPHDASNYLLENGSSTDLWHLEATGPDLQLVRDVSSCESTNMGRVHSLRHAEQLARRATRRQIVFAAHPLLSPVVPIWGNAMKWSNKALRRHITSSRTRLVEREQAASAHQLQELSPTIRDALNTLEWQSVQRLPNSSSRQQLLLYRIKGARRSGWDRDHARRGCPHCPCAGADGGTVTHTMWDCPAAQTLWFTLRHWWADLGLWYRQASSVNQDFLTSIFSLQLPRLPPKIWELHSLRQCPQSDSDSRARALSVLQVIWQQLVLETFVVISSWRNSLHDPDRAWSTSKAKAYHFTACGHVLDALGFSYGLDTSRHPSDSSLVYDIVSTFGLSSTTRADNQSLAPTEPLRHEPPW